MTTSWPGEWLRGPLTLAVLRILDDGPTYGYAIATRLEENGFGAIKGGTLYPLLSRLETAGQVTTSWQQGDGGPGRKYFELTPAGREEFRVKATLWREFAGATVRFIGEEER